MGLLSAHQTKKLAKFREKVANLFPLIFNNSDIRIGIVNKVRVLPVAFMALLAGCGSNQTAAVLSQSANTLSFEASVKESADQYRGILRVENHGDESITLTGSACPLMLRVYNGDKLVWDQGENSACIMIYSPLVIEPGQEVELATKSVSASEIMSRGLEAGKYSASAYVVGPEYRGPEEFEAGQVELH
jgi:hypothetical protein